MKLGLQLNRLPGEVVVNWKPAKDFFTTTTSNFQTTTQELTDISSAAMQNAISTSVTNWLQAHPVIFRIFNTIIWGIDHPIISLVIIFLTIAIVFSILRALNRLLEMIALSVLQVPFKLVKTGLQLGWLSSLGRKQKLTGKNVSYLALNNANTIMPQNPQERLAEISQRLQVLQKEHSKLLQEAATILDLTRN